jgi:hypothetical protein
MNESYMEKSAFTRAYLSTIRGIMEIMCVPLVELLCQMAMGWIPTLKHLLSFGDILLCQALNAADS